MIAKVKIAPLEKWCEPMKQAAARMSPTAHLAQGCEVGIETSSMRTAQRILQCGGREWLLVAIPDSIRVFDASNGSYEMERQGWICEHMLEMD